jgi:hypothetical protein
MPRVLEETTSREIDRDHITRRVDDWSNRIDALYRQVAGWLPVGWTADREGTMQMREELMGIEAKQRINDQAYFVLCWGQLEAAIDDICRTAIRNRQSSGNWAVRRAWDLYNPNESRLSGLRFEDRTALVLDR